MRQGYAYEFARTAMPDVDVVLLLGARLNFGLNFGWAPRWSPSAKFIQVDVASEEIGRNRQIDVPIVGDAGLAAAELASLFEFAGGSPRSSAWLDEALVIRHDRLAAVGNAREGRLHPMRIARSMARAFDPNGILVGDGANFLNWVRATIRVQHPASWLDHAPLGSMGVGVPFGIGASAATQDIARRDGGTPRQVMVASGDGSFGFFPIELHTAARHGLPFTLVIANDGGWGADRNTQQVTFGRNSGVDFGFGRYDELARALDCWGTRVDRADYLDVALRSAAEQTCPAVLNVITDPAAGAERRADPMLEFQLERTVV
jgi:thiamine pyrophosphate-dependent acetolactate synthase large subunit-like protein